MTRLTLLAAALGCLTSGVATERSYCPVVYSDSPIDCEPVPEHFFGSRDDEASASSSSGGSSDVLQDAFAALSVMQNTYFESVNGTWPTSIDWTGAVIETVVSGMLNTMTKSLDSVKDHDWTQKENLMASIFAQVTHSYYGQNAVGILGEAYDDVLWVVLGWLEAIKYVRLHSSLHYQGTEHECLHIPGDLGVALQTESWQGYNWLCTFAERARAFWDFATNGWDTTLCHGGMIWNPRLLPYKNAITNELWIAASISMYEYFPNDKFQPSFAVSKGFPTQDPVYLAAAVEGYKWLQGVNMTNSQGLYVDGYHVDMSIPGNVECDQRNEDVYTYNQGVVLTGQRGLYTVTGATSYLDDGHKLIRNVINATGWDLRRNKPIDKIKPGQLPPWRGIGRGGILEELCDADGSCSQDAQTFKGIFMHHLTAFCAPIDPSTIAPASVNASAAAAVQAAHDKTCKAYTAWVKYNADAALATRDSAGRFGMWWGAGIFKTGPVAASADGINHNEPNTTDYRNKGTPRNSVWGLNATWEPGERSPVNACQDLKLSPNANIRVGLPPAQAVLKRDGDPNDRGRGRTVETQAGGIAVLRAAYELAQS